MDCLGLQELGLHLRLVRQRQTQWSNLCVRNRPCAALKATCHLSTRGTVTHHFKPMEIKVKEFLNKLLFLEICPSNTTELQILKEFKPKKYLNKHPGNILQETYYKRTMLRKGKIQSNTSDSLYLSLSRIKSKNS